MKTQSWAKINVGTSRREETAACHVPAKSQPIIAMNRIAPGKVRSEASHG
jgi:hypothetical protein